MILFQMMQNCLKLTALKTKGARIAPILFKLNRERKMSDEIFEVPCPTCQKPVPWTQKSQFRPFVASVANSLI